MLLRFSLVRGQTNRHKPWPKMGTRFAFRPDESRLCPKVVREAPLKRMVHSSFIPRGNDTVGEVEVKETVAPRVRLDIVVDGVTKTTDRGGVR